MQDWPDCIERAEDHPFERVIQISILVDDHRGIAAEFEYDLLLARLGLQIPAHAGRAGKAQQLQPLVGGEQVGPVAAGGEGC